MKAKQFLFLFSILIFGLFFIPSCKENDCCSQPEINYSTGVFVVNEGGFGSTGTITWHNPQTGETVQDVFGRENDGAALGEFVQSISFYNGRGYIVVNGANKVVVVDAATFQFVDTIGGLALPRFFQRSTGNPNVAFVSQWGADGLSGSLAVVDLNNNMVIKTIPTGSGPEKMLALNSDVLYVANSGGYGVDSTVTLVSMFVEQAQTVRRQMANAAIKERLFLAHGLKGSARGVGAFPIAECASAVEDSPTDRLVLKRLTRLIDEACDFIASIDR